MSLTELVAAVPVDVMPGAGDPANYTLPQQPLHRCLLPGAAAYSTLHRSTNPHDFEIDGVHFLGTAGQNVDDVCRWVGWVAGELGLGLGLGGLAGGWRVMVPAGGAAPAAVSLAERLVCRQHSPMTNLLLPALAPSSRTATCPQIL